MALGEKKEPCVFFVFSSILDHRRVTIGCLSCIMQNRGTDGSQVGVAIWATEGTHSHQSPQLPLLTRPQKEESGVLLVDAFLTISQLQIFVGTHRQMVRVLKNQKNQFHRK